MRRVRLHTKRSLVGHVIAEGVAGGHIVTPGAVIFLDDRLLHHIESEIHDGPQLRKQQAIKQRDVVLGAIVSERDAVSLNVHRRSSGRNRHESEHKRQRHGESKGSAKPARAHKTGRA